MLKHEHFGRVRPHRHTSYASLAFLLVVTGTVLMGMSFAAQAAVPAVNPQQGSVGLTGTVRGPAPSTKAVILRPQSGSRTAATPVTVSGLCATGTFVNVTKNNVFAGVVPCEDDGTFSLLVDLFEGANTLVARLSDVLGQYGPDSAPVSVFYDAPDLNVPGGRLGKIMFLRTDTTVTGGNPGQAVSRSVTIVGGVGPYAVSWDWGDDKTSLSSQADEGPVSAQHVYERPGTYRVIVRVTDSTGNSAFMQVVTVVNGPAEAYGASKGGGSSGVSGVLLAAWPLFVLAAAMVLFFWLGERREVHKLKKRNLLLAA